MSAQANTPTACPSCGCDCSAVAPDAQGNITCPDCGTVYNAQTGEVCSASPLVFQHVLKAANATAAAPVAEGFALSETEMNQLDFSIATFDNQLADAVNNLTAANEQLTTINQQLTAVNDQLLTANDTNTTLEARIAELEAKPAAIVDPGAAADPTITGESKYATSFDAEIRAAKKMAGYVK